MATAAKWEQARREINGPVELAARKLFASPDGKKVLDTLSKVFEQDPVAMTPSGVDPHGTLVNVGAAKVIHYLRELAEAHTKGDRES